tara:strand:- start:32578 stop:33405 length:828 start_codon:yes stop_codon:yes gene_type:complete
MKASRLAICISGTLRSFRQTHESLKAHVIEPFDGRVDIFLQANIHPDSYQTWHDSDQSDSTWTDYSEALKAYRPKRTQATEYSQEEIDTIHDRLHEELAIPKSVDSIGCSGYLAFKGIRECFEMAKEHGPYDIYVRCRFDSFFHAPVDFGVYEEYLPTHVMLPYPRNRKPGENPTFFNDYKDNKLKYDPFAFMNDQFAYGSEAGMDYYSSLSEEMLRYCSPLRGHAACYFRMDEILNYHLLRPGAPFRPIIDEEVYMNLMRQDGLEDFYLGRHLP